MTVPKRLRNSLCLTLLFGGLLSGCVGSSPAPPILGQVPAFRLVSDRGEPFDSSSLEGRTWLASFLFTSCPGPCPLLVERLKTIRAETPAAELELVSFSVDPETDTPAVLAQYKTARGIANSDAWTFVTGPKEDVINLVRKGFLTGVEQSQGAQGEGLVTHGVRVVLVDGQQRIRGFYATDNEEDLQRLKRDVAAL